MHSNNFYICFIDWEIEDINGVELIKFIREETDNNYVPIIMITGYSTNDYIKIARDAGITEYVINLFLLRSYTKK